MEGASVLRLFPLNNIEDVLENADGFSYLYIQQAKKYKDEMYCLVDFLKDLDPNGWAKRIERNIVDIYTNDNDIFQKLKSLPLKIRKAYEPGDNIDFLDKNIIIAKKYPHNEFKYRVYILPHKIKDLSEKKSYIEWISAQSYIKISDAVKRWFLNTSWNWDRRYVLVKDQQNLLMLKLRHPTVVGRIYEYRLSDK